jgi:hypothetical protein
VGHGPDGIRHPNAFAIRIRQNVAQRAFVKQLTHESQGRGQATFLQKIGKRGLVLVVSNPFEKALAERSPAGKLGQLGTASTGYQYGLSIPQALYQRIGQWVHEISLGFPRGRPVLNQICNRDHAT